MVLRYRAGITKQRAPGQNRHGAPFSKTQRGHRSTAGHCFAKAEMPVRVRLAAPFYASVADTERHLFCKQVDVGAKPTGGPIFIRCFPWCNSSTSLCEGDGAGAEPAGKPNFKNVRKAKKPSQWFASPPYPVQVRGARPLCFRGVRVHARHFAKVEARGANPRGSAISLVRSLTARASGS